MTPYVVGLFGVLVMILLAIACGNVANLLLSRGAARTREAAVRLAVGAGRWRLVRPLMAESMLIGLAGAAVGLGIAALAVRILSTIEVPGDVPIVFAFRVDTRVVLFTMIVAVGSAIAFGLVPALTATRMDLVSGLRPGAAGAWRRGAIGRTTLVVVQVAGSLVLLVAAAQLSRGFSAALLGDHGFRVDHRLTMRVDPSLLGYTPAQREQFHQALVNRAAQVPGVRSAALTSALPMIGDFGLVSLAPEGFEFPAGQHDITSFSAVVDPGYFSTLDVGIVQGRGFLETDGADTPLVAIVNETFARRYLGENPIGKRLRLSTAGNRAAEVVGVTVSGKYASVFAPPMDFVYLPFTQNPGARMTLIVETAGDPAAVAGPLRQAVRELDVNVPVFGVRTMEDIFEQRSVRVANILLGLVVAVGVIGLCLALVGLYALIAFHVNRRTREIGIRMAVGAARVDVVKMVLTQAAAMGGIGVLIGLAPSFLIGRVLPAAFGEPQAFDPIGFSAIPIALLLTALLAAGIPARRAATIDPQQALRAE